MNVKYAVQVLLDVDWDNLEYRGKNQTSHLDEKWVRDRINMFEKLTLPSLLQQGFQAFDIMLLCGTEYRSITENHPWHPRIKLFYDLGEAFITGQKADHFVVTRIDSDDLFHWQAMNDVRSNLILSEKRECLIFRKHYLWDMIHRFIYQRERRSPSFFVHIFPRKLYQNWPEYRKQHYIVHIEAGGKLPTTKRLRDRMTCVTRHEGNHQYRRLHLDVKEYLSDKELEKRTRIPSFVNDREKMAEILKPFGVSRKSFEEFC